MKKRVTPWPRSRFSAGATQPKLDQGDGVNDRIRALTSGRGALTAAGLGLAMLAGAAVGETPAPFAAIALGQSVSGDLKAGDRVEPDGTYFDA